MLALPQEGQLRFHVTDFAMLPLTAAVNCACVPMVTVPAVEELLHGVLAPRVVQLRMIELAEGSLYVAVTVVLMLRVAVQLLGVPLTGVQPDHDTKE
jgi:hypothetical protein